MDLHNMFSQVRTKRDYDRASELFQRGREEFEMKKQTQRAKLDKMRTDAMMRAQGGDGPASVQEWKFYSSLSPEEQQRYLGMKRAAQIMNLGGTMAVRNPHGGIQEQYRVTPREVDMPEFKGAQAGAQQDAQNQSNLNYAAGIEREKVQGRGVVTPLQEQEQSRQQVSKMLGDLRSDFEELGKLGGIVDENEGAIENISRSVGASGFGQYLGKITGSKAQTIRKRIDDAKPKLLLAIMRAGGASARSLDSDNELKQWLLTTGDTQSSLQANLELYDRLEKLIGMSAKPQNPGQEQFERERNANRGVVSWEEYF